MLTMNADALPRQRITITILLIKPAMTCSSHVIPLSGVQLDEHVRDVRGEINKDMKRAVQLAYGGVVASKKDDEDDKGGPSTAEDCEKALSLLAGTPLPHGA